MKIAVVHGQAHKGSTYHLTHMLLDRFNGEETDVLEFYVNDLGNCTGCFTCIRKDEKHCPHRKQTAPVIEAIEAADIIIMDSPNYVMGMSGQLKTFCDHMGYRWMSHRPHSSMRDKIGVAVSTAAGAGALKVTKDICSQFFWWNVGKTYCLPFIAAASSWNEVKPGKRIKMEKAVDKLAKKINRKTGKVKPGIKSRLYFFIMKGMHKNMSYNPVDSAYWKNQGWIK